MKWFLALSMAALHCGCSDIQHTRTNANAGTATKESVAEPAETADRAETELDETPHRQHQSRDAQVAQLVQSLRSENRVAQLAAATTLSELGSDAVPALTNAVSDKDYNVRTWAIAILGAIGEPASNSLPVVSASINDQQPEVAALAATAMAQIGGRPAASVFAASMKHPVKEVRRQALVFLQSADADMAVPAMRIALRDEDAELRWQAAMSLGTKSHWPEAASAIPNLCAAIHDPDARVRWWAVHAIATFDEQSREAVPHLIEILQDPDRSVRQEAVRALGEIGPEPGVVPALIDLLHDSDAHLRAEAAESLSRMGSAGRAALPALHQLRGESPEFVVRAVDQAIKRLSQQREHELLRDVD